MPVIGRPEISVLVYEKCSRTIHRKMVYNVVRLVFNYLAKELLENRAVSVNNFGTFSCRICSAKVNLGLNSKYRITKASRVVKFIPHANFSKLIQARKQDLIDAIKT